MRSWLNILVSPNTPIIDTLKIIDQGALQIALVIDDNQRLVGTVTDGDIRRGILKGLSLDKPVIAVMNPNPIVGYVDQDKASLARILNKKHIRHLPIIDRDRRIVGLESKDSILNLTGCDNIVVIMAGGLGVRLRPLTKECPKPLLKVGGKPVLELILERFIDQGFSKFFVSVNYKAEMIESYFGDGSKWGVQIDYLKEDVKLGTAGALSLLPEKPELPFIVMNGDLVTQLNFKQLINFHEDNHSEATVAVREYSFQVPYGVAQMEHNRLVAIEEKPVHRFFVNAGIYVFQPVVMNLVKANEKLDMPVLLNRVNANGWKTVAFPIREYWRDIGQMDDYRMANEEITEEFTS